MPDEEKKSKSAYVNYPSNSHKSRVKSSKKEENSEKTEKPEKVVEPVILGTAKRRKKSFWKKLAEGLTSDDGQTVGSYILWDVLIPSLKKMILEAGSQGLERALYRGEIRHRSGRSRDRDGRYERAYDGRRHHEPPRRELSARARRNFDFEEVLIPTRGEAEDILERLRDLIDNYDVATLSDFYNLIGETRDDYVSDNWGWYSLRDAQVVREIDGYFLDLPRPEPID